MSDVYYFEVDAFPDDTPHDALRHCLVTITEVDSPHVDGTLSFQIIGNWDEITLAAAVMDVDHEEIERVAR